jgi:hypothetical protein
MTPDMLQLSEAHNKEGYLQSKLPLTTTAAESGDHKNSMNTWGTKVNVQCGLWLSCGMNHHCLDLLEQFFYLQVGNNEIKSATGVVF